MLPKSLQRLAIAEREGNRASHGTHRVLHSRVRCAAVMAAEPGRSGRRRRRGSRGFPPPAQTPPRTATAPAGDGTACPAGTHRVSAVSSPRTASPDAPAILMSPRAWVRSLISFPGTTAIASGEQAGSGSARPHLQSKPVHGSGARVLALAIAPVITQCPRTRPGLHAPANMASFGTHAVHAE